MNRLSRLFLIGTALKAIQIAGLTYDRSLGRYRGVSGRFLSPQDVRRVIDADIDVRASRFDKHAGPVVVAAQQYQDGKISLQQYQQAVDEWAGVMAGNIRDLHMANLAAAKGGTANVGYSDYGRAGQLIQVQYEYLKRFREQIYNDPSKVVTKNEAESGTPGGAFTSRCEMYAESGRITYEVVRKLEDDSLGLVWTYNELDDRAMHCKGPNSCPAQSEKGVVHSSEMTMVTLRACGQYCRCHTPRFQTRDEALRAWKQYQRGL